MTDGKSFINKLLTVNVDWSHAGKFKMSRFGNYPGKINFLNRDTAGSAKRKIRFCARCARRRYVP
jgi:hypothetical protein